MIEAALAAAHSTWHTCDRERLLAGNRDEDDLVIFGRRFRAAGLSHTYKPASPRFGELFAPSAKRRLLACVRRARARRDRAEAAWWLGRACHLLGDMAVPARTRGVWHLLGDPLETWLEAQDAGTLHAMLGPTGTTWPEEPAAIADVLARASSGLAADTTRTPWGKLAYERFGRGMRLDDVEVERQARILVPLAVEATAALLRAVGPA